MFVPPLNLGGFQPSPVTLAQWVYQIWQYLQENPIATEEQLKEYIGTFITTSPETQTMIGEGVEQYLTDNPPAAPVQSVQGKTGAVVLNYPDIVPASNAVPVYRAASVPSVNTLIGQYNLGYRLFVNTATQEIYTITPAGALSLVGRGKFDGTTIDVNTTVGDTTIAEAFTAIDEDIAKISTACKAVTFSFTTTTSASGAIGVDIDTEHDNLDIRQYAWIIAITSPQSYCFRRDNRYATVFTVQDGALKPLANTVVEGKVTYFVPVVTE